MRKLFFIGLLLLNSCDEAFQNIDPTEFNDLLSERSDIETGEALMKAYYNPTLGEGKPVLTIESLPYKKDMLIITLIHDGLLDDSMRAMKIILIAKKEQAYWKVLEIKKNWKCRVDRGHEDWGIELCN